jgi:DNA modification methylase
MDKIFGIDRFLNEIVWEYRTGGISKKWFPRKHDILFLYTKSENFRFFTSTEKVHLDAIGIGKQQGEWAKKMGIKLDENQRPYRYTTVRDVWDVNPLFNASPERIGYPTQKPETLIGRILHSSSAEGDVIADFFCGGASAPFASHLWIGHPALLLV